MRPRNFMICAALAAMATASVAARFYLPVVVLGSSMTPSLTPGRVALLDRRYYKDHSVKPGDVVVFKHAGETFIKRVYATAGQFVTVVRLAQDDYWLEEDLKKSLVGCYLLKHLPPGGAIQRIRVPERSVFVLGDNRSRSVDSRSLGPVPIASLMGYVRQPGQNAAG